MLYGLKYNGKILGCSFIPLEGGDEVSPSVGVELSEHSIIPWLTKSKFQADFSSETKFYLAVSDISSPYNPYAGKCEVVKVKVTEV